MSFKLFREEVEQSENQQSENQQSEEEDYILSLYDVILLECYEDLKFKLEDLKYWFQLRLTDIEFGFNMKQSELQTNYLGLMSKCFFILIAIFYCIYLIWFLQIFY